MGGEARRDGHDPTAGAARSQPRVSTLFRSINEAERDEFVEVYAPVQFKDEKDKRTKLREYGELISGIIRRLAKGEDEEVIR
ncbi:MAG: hypothetical protein QHH27_01760 [Clostridia bacterium]|nr:hypothetical protein [Clostridia bacterium]MDH7572263.1 hypothetical protein [Clostridia bacterium]